MRLIIRLLLAAIVATASASAQTPPAPAEATETPRIASTPGWVERVAIPQPNPALSERPFQSLLLNAQSFYGPEHHEHYLEFASLIQTMQGLQGLGSIVLPWRPEDSELIVNKVHIVRAGTVIDLLGAGQTFTVLRREDSLESATLNGVLTAVMQPEGLAVGDVLNVAFTVRRRPGSLPLRAENFFALPPGVPVRQYYVRQVWPAGRSIRWRGTDALRTPRTRNSRHGTELVVSLADVESPQPPEMAPPRFSLPITLQVSEYGSWSEVGSILAPYYDRAAELGPNSPLRREIERIAAATQDPGGRAMAALRLVQEDIRYFALAMGEGNYLPATADQTWSRRFGDCKGKTATLIALLRGLGIEAEPVLVSTAMGDSLRERLPQMILFDHVIVRARINGRSYWLDGTRTGDRRLADLASSTLSFGLPVRAGGAELEEIPYMPPELPLTEQNITYDGSRGFADPLPVRAESIFRGDVATAFRTSLSQLGREEFLRQLGANYASYLPEGQFEITNTDYRDDPENGSFAILMTGTTRMPWAGAPGTGSQRFRFDNGTVEWNETFDRRAGASRDVPFALGVPVHIESTETVILPNGGEGYSTEGADFDRTIAGTRIRRQVGIEGGRAVARSAFIRVAREIGAAEARASVEPLAALSRDRAYLRAPFGAALSAPPRPGASSPAAASTNPQTAEALNDAGFHKMAAGRSRQALADFDQAIELAPGWGLPRANRGIALTHLNRLEEAEQALAEAMRLDEENFAAHQGYGLLRIKQDRPDEAIRYLTRSLELRPDDLFTLGRRIDAYERIGRLDDALSDIERMTAIESRHAFAYLRRARILTHLGREDEAVAALDQAMRADPGNFAFARLRGDLLHRMRRTAEAEQAYREGLAMLERLGASASAESSVGFASERAHLLLRSGRQDEAFALVDQVLRRLPGNGMMLNTRCRISIEANRNLRITERYCREALEADAGDEQALEAGALVALRAGRWAEAIRGFEQLIASDPQDASALYGRGIARLRNGDSAGGERDLAAARRYAFDVGAEYERLGLAVPAAAAAASD